MKFIHLLMAKFLRKKLVSFTLLNSRYILDSITASERRIKINIEINPITLLRDQLVVTKVVLYPTTEIAQITAW